MYAITTHDYKKWIKKGTEYSDTLSGVKKFTGFAGAVEYLMGYVPHPGLCVVNFNQYTVPPNYIAMFKEFELFDAKKTTKGQKSAWSRGLGERIINAYYRNYYYPSFHFQAHFDPDFGEVSRNKPYRYSGASDAWNCPFKDPARMEEWAREQYDNAVSLIRMEEFEYEESEIYVTASIKYEDMRHMI